MKLKLLSVPQDGIARTATDADITDDMIAAVERSGGPYWNEFQRTHPTRVDRYLAAKTLGQADSPRRDWPTVEDTASELRRNTDRARQETARRPVHQTVPTPIVPTPAWSETDRQAANERLRK